MNTADSNVSALRVLVADLETEIATSTNDKLRDQWATFVTVLALGPAPATRVCPSCKRVGMKAASRCGYCWSHLDPLP